MDFFSLKLMDLMQKQTFCFIIIKMKKMKKNLKVKKNNTGKVY